MHERYREATVRRRILGFGTWCAALLLGTALFHALGDGSLAPPPLDPSAWGPWIQGRDALVATMALLRLVVLGLCWYLVGVTTVGTVARLLRAARLTRLADALTLPIVRRLLQQTLGMVLATTMVTAATGQGLVVPAASPAQVAAGVGEDDAPTDTTTGSLGSDAAILPRVSPGTGVGIARGAQAPADGVPEVTLRGLPAPAETEGLPLPWRIAEADAPPGRDEPADNSGMPDAADAAPSRHDPTDSSGMPDAADRDTVTERTTHTVRSGESLWRIASHRLARSFGRAPTDAEIVPYWRELIEMNRDRLPDRDDPDLILPGQELLLPPVAVS